MYLTFSKLSIQLKQEWEMHLGNFSEPPSFGELQEFLKGKVTNLKNLGDAAKTHFAQPYSMVRSSGGENKMRFIGQTVPENVQASGGLRKALPCVYCSKPHNIIMYDF